LSDEERDILTADALDPAAYIPDLVAGPATVHSLLCGGGKFFWFMATGFTDNAYGKVVKTSLSTTLVRPPVQVSQMKRPSAQGYRVFP